MFQVNSLLGRGHVKNQASFSLKEKSKKLKCRLLQFLFGALRVRLCFLSFFILLSSSRYLLLDRLFISVIPYTTTA